MPPHLRWALPRLVRDDRCVGLRQAALVPLRAYRHPRKGPSPGSALIDSTLLAVCHPKRSARHRVGAGLAGWGKKAVGRGYGGKLPLLLTDLGEVGACRLTPATGEGRRPVPGVVKGLRGKVVGERGYISRALVAALFAHGAQLMPTLRKAMKNKLPPGWTNWYSVDAPSVNPSMISSKIAPRVRTPVTAVWPTAWAIWSRGCSPIRIRRRNLRSTSVCRRVSPCQSSPSSYIELTSEGA